MDDAFDSFGDWVRRRRRTLDLTQAALAGKVCCSAAAIKKIEAEERRPSRALAQRLAEQLAIPAPQRSAFVQAARLARADIEPADQGDTVVAMVGRTEHIAALSLTLAAALRGAGQVVLVQGEAGIGKSRLLQETVVTARRAGVPALTTNCYEIERVIAYQPVIALAAQACALLPVPALRQVPPVLLAELAELVPALASQVPDLPALSGEFPEARQARLFQALVQLFDAAAQGAGLLLAVDDVQWADDASVRFLHHYARQVRERPVLLACSLRDDALEASADLAAAIAGLRGEANARRLLLPRLSLADVEVLLRGLDPPLPAAPGLAGRLLRESEGNPFVLWSVLHAWRDAGVPMREEESTLPSDLRDSVRARLGHLPREDRALLDVAAVLGRRFHFELLLALGQLEPEAFAQGLENLERRGLLRQEDDGHYDFSHDKVREVVYGDIGAARRVLLHRQVVQHLAAQADPVAQEAHGLLAEHCERGALWPQALHYLVLAAGHAERLFAVRQALQWFDRAVALLEAHREAGTPMLRLALHERRGALRAQAGQTEGAVADFQRAIELARAAGEQRAARDALVSLGMAYRRADHYEQAVACLDEALAAARASGAQRQVADILYHLGTVAWSNGRNDLAIAHHQEAVDLCRRLGLRDLVAVQAFHGRGEAALAEGRPLAALDCFARSLELARALGDRGYEAENLLMLGWSRVDGFGTGDARAAMADFDASLAATRAGDLYWHLAPALIGRAQAHATLGDVAQAWADLGEALRSAAALGLVRYQLMVHDLMGELHLRAGQLADAAREFERALLLAGSAGIRYWLPRVQAGLAIARLRGGADVDVAGLQAALQQSRVHREAWLFPRCLQALAEAALRQGDTRAAAAHADELAAHAAAGGLQAVAVEAGRLQRLARAGGEKPLGQ